jgi:hypothetical protein
VIRMLRTMDRLTLATELVSANNDAITSLGKCIVSDSLYPSCLLLNLRSVRDEGKGKAEVDNNISRKNLRTLRGRVDENTG